jgi:hypothetical protein
MSMRQLFVEEKVEDPSKLTQLTKLVEEPRNAALLLQGCYYVQLLEYIKLREQLAQLESELILAEKAQTEAIEKWKNVVEEAKKAVDNENLEAAKMSLTADESSLKKADAIFKANDPALIYLGEQKKEISRFEHMIVALEKDALGMDEEKREQLPKTGDVVTQGCWRYPFWKTLIGAIPLKALEDTFGSAVGLLKYTKK